MTLNLPSLFSSLGLAALLASTVGCAPLPDGEEPKGELHFALTTVPPAVQCIQIVAMGPSSTVTRNLTVASGGSSVGLSLGALPLGLVTISGQAFSQACSGISGQTAGWIADSQQVTLQPGVVSSLIINFRPNNAVSGTANFVGNLTQVALGWTPSVGLVLSDGTVRASGDYILGSAGSTFTTVPGLANVRQLAYGGVGVGCVVHTNGSLECFGDNSGGSLGNGTTTNSLTPVPVGVGTFTEVAQVNLGGASCAIDRRYGLYCWGLNFSGQVGNGTTTNALSPVQVDASAVSVAGGGTTTCDVSAIGLVSCWGDNRWGQVGNGTAGANVLSPKSTGLFGAVGVAVGTAHACAVKGDGTVKCWGGNYAGQLGAGSGGGSSSPAAVPGLTTVQQLVAFGDSTCARKANGSVWCWGSNMYGELGDGSGTNSSVPIQVQGLPPSAQLAAAYSVVCSIGTNQSLYCWGLNLGGQLATGTKAAALTPVQVNP
jgi:alpha-tubulin suppressor-like RCC1 family protein